MLNRDLEQDRQAVINDLVNATIILIVKKFNWSTKKAKKLFKNSATYDYLFFWDHNIEYSDPVILLHMFDTEMKMQPVTIEDQEFYDCMSEDVANLIVKNKKITFSEALHQFEISKTYWNLTHSGHDFDHSSPEHLYQMYKNECKVGLPLPTSMIEAGLL